MKLLMGAEFDSANRACVAISWGVRGRSRLRLPGWVTTESYV